MLTPTHIALDLAFVAVVAYFFGVQIVYTDIFLVLSSNFIDLDHLSARPAYHPRRNSFKTHFLHRGWIWLSLMSVFIIFIRPLAFLGVGLLLHFFLDHLENRWKGI